MSHYITEQYIKELEAKCKAPSQNNTVKKNTGLPLCPTHGCLLVPKRNSMPKTGTEGELMMRAKLPKLYECPDCNYEEFVNPDFTQNQAVIDRKIKKYKTRVNYGEKDEIRDTTEVDCPKCHNNIAYYTSKQMRSADEPETFFYECIICGNKWRED